MNCIVRIAIALSLLQVHFNVVATANGFTQDDKDPWIGKPLMPKIGAQIETNGMETIPLDEIDYPMFATASKGQYLVLRLPNSPKVLRSRTVTLESAEKYYLKLIKEGRDAKQARIFLTILELRRKNYSRAIAYSDKVLASEPRNKFALFLRAKASNLSAKSFHLKTQSKNALEDLEKCLKIDPNYADAIALKAFILSTSGNDNDSRKLFDRALNLKPKVGKYYELSGVGYFQSGDHEKAAKELLKAIELEPLNPRFAGTLAWIYAESGRSYRNTDKPIGNLKKSHEFATKACELSNWKNADMIRMLISISGSLGKTVEIQKLERILEELPK
jgi:Tfp pilus assembly protein PilF